MSVHRLARLTVGLLVAMIVAALASTTTAGAATFSYDVPAVMRVDTPEFGPADASTALRSQPREWAARGDVESRGASTTPYARSVATEAVPPIKPGASGGLTAGKPFGTSVKASVVAENLSVTGAENPVCVWCHMETETPHVDHAVPRSFGGDATLENGQVACPHCNLSRGNRPAPVTPPTGYEGPWPPPWWVFP